MHEIFEFKLQVKIQNILKVGRIFPYKYFIHASILNTSVGKLRLKMGKFKTGMYKLRLEMGKLRIGMGKLKIGMRKLRIEIGKLRIGMG